MVTACGLKAAPKPRETVVPAHIDDLKVRIVSEGIEVAFPLPATSLDGSRLREIGGYRIIRRGEGKGENRREITLSVTDRRRLVGKEVVVIDAPPLEAGHYDYYVIPFDIYGSRPSGDGRSGLLSWPQ